VSIVIVASGVDPHAVSVLRRLRERGQDALIVDLDALGRDARVLWRVGVSRGLVLGAGSIAAEDVGAMWLRRAVPDRVTVPGLGSSDAEFAAREWRETLEGFLHLPVPRVNDPAAQARAKKPVQLEVATALGFRVPETLVTNDRDEAVAFVTEHRRNVVHKVLTHGGWELAEARGWDADADEALDRLILAPTILQRRIEGPADVRATVVGDRIFAARFEARAGSPLDARLDPDAPCAVFELPASVGATVLALIKGLGLLYGAVDFKVDGAGELYFLEVNPGGQFLGVEILTGLPISAAMADLLVELASTAADAT
jgi:glutathione synthase/RimK-type ligase-like ATP-grasp enzyme